MRFPEITIIKKRRLQLDLTQKELAEMAQVSQSLIAKIESLNMDASYDNVKKIFEALDDVASHEEKRCSQAMNKKIFKVDFNENIEKAKDIMKHNSISQLPIFKGDWVIGSISESAILRAMEHQDKEKLFKQSVESIAEEAFPIVHKETAVDSVIPLLKKSSAVLVSEKGRIVGIITRTDLM